MARIPGSMAACRGKVLTSAAVAEFFIATASMPGAAASGSWAAALGIACMPGATKDPASSSTSGIRIRQELLASGHGWRADDWWF